MELRYKSPVFFIVIFIISTLMSEYSYSKTPLKNELKPNSKDSEISSVFEDMIVVQRKAKEKGGSFLFSPFGTFDFSDGPKTMYAMNVSLGYAFSDFWEFYINYVPSFFSNDRSIVKILEDKFTEIKSAEPKSQIGAELLWAPAYGKDSWGPYSIVRSDTFFKLGVGQISYENESGMRYSLSLGKTYFLSNWFNLRIAAGGSFVETILDDQKSSRFVAIFEMGLVYYIQL